MFRPSRSLFSLFLLVFLFSLGFGVWGQSRIPAENDDYLGAAYRETIDWHGDSDKFTVLFFEVDASVTQTLYFGVYDPGIDAGDFGDANRDPGDMKYELYGGVGAYSNASARRTSYTSGQARTGTLLNTMDVLEGVSANAGYNDTWVYFGGVSPSQGELVGNKRIFKVVVEAKIGTVDQGGDAQLYDYKNLYQVATSLSNSGVPIAPSGVRAFSYCLPMHTDVGVTFDLYPFVPDAVPGYPAYPGGSFGLMFYNHDSDFVTSNTGRDARLRAYNASGTLLGDINISGSSSTLLGDGGQFGGAQYGYDLDVIASQTNSTWRLNSSGGNEAYPADTGSNIVEFFFSADESGAFTPGNSLDVDADAVALRIYASAYTPLAAYRVTLAPASQTVADGATASITAQIVDTNGDPAPYSRTIAVSATGGSAPSVNGAGANTTIVTDSSGTATFTLTNGAAGTVTIGLLTNGSSGSQNFGAGTDDGASVIFSANPAPTISSVSNLSFTEDTAGINHPIITVASNGGTQITNTSDVRIRIPTSLSATFNTGVTPNVTVAGGAGAVGAVTVTAGQILIDVTTSLAATASLTIGSTTRAQYATASNASSGTLELSVDGGITWTLLDDKVVIINSAGGVKTWTGGSSSTDWFTAGNWSGGLPIIGDNVLVPVVGNGFYPVLTSSPPAIADLTIASGASLGLSTFTIAPTGIISVSGTMSGTGSFQLAGGNRSGNISTGNGNIVFTSPITLTGDLTVNAGAGTVTFSGAATVNGGHRLTVTSTGAKNFNSLIGNSTPLQRLTATGAGTNNLGAATYQFAGNTTTFAGPVVVATNTTISDTTGPIEYLSTLTINTGVTLTLIAPEIDFAANVSGPGNLVLQAYGSAAIALAGAAGTGNLDLTATEIGLFQNSLASVTIGDQASSLTWNGAATLNVTTTFLGNLNIAGGTLTLGANLTVAGDGAGANGDVTIAGTLTPGANSVTLDGNWTRSGTFNQGTSTVVIRNSNGDLSHTINGNTTFYNLTSTTATAASLTFAADSVTTIALGGILNFAGASGNLLTLTSSNPVGGDEWSIVVNTLAGHTLSFLDVRYSFRTISTQATLNSTFTATSGWAGAYTWAGANSTWNLASNWTPNTGYPGTNDSVTISIASPTPLLPGALSLQDLTIGAGASIDLGGSNLTVAGTVTKASTAIVYLRGTETGSTPSLFTTGITNYNATSGGPTDLLEFGGTDYEELRISGTITYSIPAAGTSVSGALTVSNGTLALGANNLSVGGNLTIGNGTTGVITQGAGAITVSGAATINVGAAASISLPTSTNTFGTSLTITSGLNITISDNGTLNFNAGTVTGTLVATAADISIGGALSVGNAEFQPRLDGDSIQLNNAGAGFALDAADLAFLSGTGTVTVGRATGTGTISIGSIGAINLSAETWNLSLRGTSSAVVFNFSGPNSLSFGVGRTLTFGAGGAITSPGNAASDVVVPNLYVSSASGVGTLPSRLQTDADTLRLGASGSVFIGDLNAVVLGGATGITTSSGDIDILAGGNVTTGNTISTTTGSGGTIKIETSSGTISVGNNIDSSANNQAITINSASTLALGASLLSGSGTITLGSGGIISRTIGTVGSTGGTATLIVNAGGNVGASGARLFTDVAIVRASVPGDLYISEATDLQLGGTTGLSTTSNGILNVLSTGGNLSTGNSISADGALTLDAGGGTPTITLSHNLSTTDDTITLSDPVSLGADASIATSSTTTNRADIVFSGAITGNNYNLTLSTGSGIANADVSATSASGVTSLTLQNIGGTATFAGAVTAGTLSIDNTVVNAAFTGASGTITNAVTFSNTGTLALGSSGGILQYTGGLTALTTGTVTLNGTIQTDSSTINLSGRTIVLGSAVTIDTETGNNSIGGSVDLSSSSMSASGAARNLSIDAMGASGSGGGAVALGTCNSSAGFGVANLTINAGLGVTDAGAGTIVISGTLGITTNNTTAGAALITLDNAGHNFGGLTLQTLNSTGAAPVNSNITLHETAAASLVNAVSTTGMFTLNSGGAITQSGGVINGGTLVLTNTVGAITLGSANTIGTLGAVNRAGSLTINDSAGGLIISGSITAGTVTNPVTISTAGGILDIQNDISTSGANTISLTGTGISQSALAIIDGGNGTILLDANDGTYDLSGSITTTSASATAVQIVDGGALVDLGTIAVSSGTVTLGAVAPNNLSGAITQKVSTTIVASILLLNGGSSATLTNTGNNVTTMSVVTGGNFSWTDADGVDFGSAVSTVTGNLTLVTTNGAVSDSQNVSVTGTTNITTTAAQNVILDRPGNDFGGAVTISGAAQVTLVDADDISLGGISATGAISIVTVATAGADTITVNGSISTSGASTIGFDTPGGVDTINLNANVTSVGGTITFSDAVVLGGGAGTITISSSGGANTGAITFSSTMDGAKDLTLNAGSSANITVAGAVGSVTPIGDGTGASLSIGTGSSVLFSGALSSSNAVTITPPVTFGANVAIATGTSTFSGTTTFNASSGASPQTFAAGGNVDFGDTVADSVSLGATGTVTSVSITTNANNGSLHFFGPISGTNDLVLSSNGSGTITLDGTITSTRTTAAGVNNISISTAGLSLAANVNLLSRDAIVNDPGNILLTIDGLTLGGTNAFNSGSGTVTIAKRTAGGDIEFAPTDSAAAPYNAAFFINSSINITSSVPSLILDGGNSGTIYIGNDLGGATPNYSLTAQGTGALAVRISNDYNSSVANKNLTVITGSGGLQFNKTSALAINLGTAIFSATTAGVTAGTVTISDNTSITANGGIGFADDDWSIDAAAAGTQTLTLVAGTTGNISFGVSSGAANARVGGTNRLGGLTITSTNDATFRGDVRSNFISQAAGNGTTRFYSGITTSALAGLNLTGTNFTIDGTVTSTTGNGTVTIVNSGALTMTDPVNATDTAYDWSLGGDFSQSGGGSVSIDADIQTSNDVITFTSPIALIGYTSLSTQSIAGSGTINLKGAVTNAVAQDLSLQAGTGNVILEGSVGGGTRLRDLTIVSAATVAGNMALTASVPSLSIRSLIQSAGSALSWFSNIDANFGAGLAIDLTGQDITFAGTVTSAAGGNVEITNAGTLTMTDPAGAANTTFDWTLGGTFTQNGTGAVSLSSDIQTSADDISWARAITLTGDVSLSTQAGAGHILFANAATIDGTGRNLTLDSGTGNISFGVASSAGNGRIGGAAGANRIGTLTISSAANVDAYGQVFAGSITQTTATGTTRFHQAVDTNGASGISLTGVNLTFDAAVQTTAGGPVALTGSGVAILNDATSAVDTGVDWSLDGSFTHNGGGTGSLSLAADIQTSNDAITFNRPVTLSGYVLLNSNNGAITFATAATINATTASTEQLITQAGSGTLQINSVVGAAQPLGLLSTDTAGVTQIGANMSASKVTFADNVTLLGSLTLDGTFDDPTLGVWDIDFAGTLGGAFNLTLAGPGEKRFQGVVSIGSVTGPSFAQGNNTGLVDFGSTVTVAQGFTQGATSAGQLTFHGDVTNSGTFASTLAGNVVLDGLDFTSNGALTFGTAAGTNTLGISAAAVRIITTGSNQTYHSTINGNQNLTLRNNGALSDITLNARIGNSSSPTSLTIDSSAGLGVGTISFGDGTGTDDIAVAGPLSWTGRIVSIRGSGISTGASAMSMIASGGATPRIVIALDANATYTASSITLNAPAVFLDSASARTLSLGTNLNVLTGSLVLYRGGINLMGRTVTIAQDFVGFGGAYSANDTERNATNPANAFFAYPFATTFPYFPNSGTYNAGTGAFSTGSGATFANTVAAAALIVGRNFYANGMDMNAAATWNVTIPNNTGSLSGLLYSINDPKYGFGSGLAGGTWAKAFNMTVANSTVLGGGVVAADESTVTVNTSTGWNRIAPTIVSARTVWDDMVEVVFTEPLENRNHETFDAINSSFHAARSFRFNGGAVKFTRAYRLVAPGVIGGAPWNLRGDSNGNGMLDPTEFVELTLTAGLTNVGSATDPLYLQVDRTIATWNTDASNASSGDANSTNRFGVHQTRTVDLWVVKGLFIGATSRNGVINYGDNAQAAYGAVSDACRPALVGGWAGKSAYAAGTGTPYNGHNFLHLRYSEPMDLSDPSLVGQDPADITISVNPETSTPVSSSAGFASFSNTSGVSATVNIVGLGLSYTGVFDLNARNASIPLRPDLDTAAPQKMNLVYRSPAPTGENPSGNLGLTIFVGGFSAASGGSLYWPAYLGTATTGNDSLVSKSLIQTTSAPYIRDSSPALNVVEPASSTYPGLIGGASTGIAVQGNATGGAGFAVGPFVDNWDVAAPQVQPDSASAFQVYSVVDSSTGNVKRLDFTLTKAVRDTSWSLPEAAEPGLEPFDNEKTGFAFGDIKQSSVSFSNLNLDIDTKVNHDDISVPITGIFANTGPDNEYFSVGVNGVPQAWTSTTSLFLVYTATGVPGGGYVTDLAGNLMRTTGILTAIERTPPDISYSLGAVSGGRLLVQFSEPVFDTYDDAGTIKVRSDMGTSAFDPAHFVFYDRLGAALGSPTAVQVLKTATPDGTSIGATQVFLDLPSALRPITPDALLEYTIGAAQDPASPPTVNNGLLADKANNRMQHTSRYRFSNVGIGIIDPVFATDDLINPVWADSIKPVNVFDGTGSLTGEGTIVLEVMKSADLDIGYQASPVRLYYDVDVADPFRSLFEGLGKFWYPRSIPGLITKANLGATLLTGTANVTNPGITDYRIPGDDAKISSGKVFEFVLEMNGLPLAWATDPNDPRTIRPWSIKLNDIATQRGNVTILNNVINPEAGDKTILQYGVAKPGNVVVMVMTIDGNVVRVLQNGQQGASERYRLVWDGKNQSGQTVARGLYLIRAVGPDFDEIRKVLVVKP